MSLETLDRWPRPSFATGIALLVLVLSLLYAMVFSNLIYISLLEEVLAHEPLPPRYARPPHFHNSAEWLLLIVPAVVGWAGVAWTAWYLLRRAARLARIAR